MENSFMTIEQIADSSDDLIYQVNRDFYTLKQASIACGVSDVTIWRWLNANIIQGHRIGREVLINKQELRELGKLR